MPYMYFFNLKIHFFEMKYQKIKEKILLEIGLRLMRYLGEKREVYILFPKIFEFQQFKNYIKNSIS